jgi:hypothetical protein
MTTTTDHDPAAPERVPWQHEANLERALARAGRECRPLLALRESLDAERDRPILDWLLRSWEQRHRELYGRERRLKRLEHALALAIDGGVRACGHTEAAALQHPDGWDTCEPCDGTGCCECEEVGAVVPEGCDACAEARRLARQVVRS